MRHKIKLGVLAALDQRLAVRYHMNGITPEETADCQRHHVALAVRTDPLFTEDAANLIHTTNRGYPRAVNNVAVQSLLATSIADKTIVDETGARSTVNEVIATD